MGRKNAEEHYDKSSAPQCWLLLLIIPENHYAIIAMIAQWFSRFIKYAVVLRTFIIGGLITMMLMGH